ncbi:hypothetical protein C2845_PM02G43470 [Panicum miliaceum]|uniref:Uncharacterized protein n=1 Tax=Panicum miliaceum TaxID=4540 RepID=A0A3L6S6I7_PANMI|nr:hypothetical protein C2845_PM02G43470 [Panicum miliaceum]
MRKRSGDVRVNRSARSLSLKLGSVYQSEALSILSSTAFSYQLPHTRRRPIDRSILFPSSLALIMSEKPISSRLLFVVAVQVRGRSHLIKQQLDAIAAGRAR